MYSIIISFQLFRRAVDSASIVYQIVLYLYIMLNPPW